LLVSLSPCRPSLATTRPPLRPTLFPYTTLFRSRDFLGRDAYLVGQLELRRQRFEHLLLGASLERDQDFAQAAPALALRRQRLLQLLARDGAVREQDLADPQACEASAGGLARGRFCDAFHWTSTSWIRLLFRRRRLFRRLFGL